MQFLRNGLTAVTLTSLCLILMTSCGSEEAYEGEEAMQNTLDSLTAIQENVQEQIDALQERMAELAGEEEELRIVPVETRTLEPTTLTHYVDVLGNVSSDLNVMVSSRQAGLVTKINVKEGDRVSENQILAQLDATIMERQLEEAETQLEFAKTVYAKRKRVWEQKVGSEIEYLKAENDVHTLERRIETLMQQIKDMTIRAPFSGVVDKVVLRLGESIAPGMPTVQLVSMRDLKVETAISERYRSYLRTGDEVKLHFPQLDLDTITTRISTISEAINASDRTFQVTVNLRGISDKIRPNMTCRVRINDRTLDSILVAPINAIQRFKDEQFVYVVKPKGENYVAERRIVETGLSYASAIEVSQGLQSGEELVTVGFQNLADGVLVDPQ